jgi:hypothetical protein
MFDVGVLTENKGKVEYENDISTMIIKNKKEESNMGYEEVKTFNKKNLVEARKQEITIANSMIKYGGSFIKCIGEALLHADNDNTIKLKSCFSEEWIKYLDISEKYMDR